MCEMHRAPSGGRLSGFSRPVRQEARRSQFRRSCRCSIPAVCGLMSGTLGGQRAFCRAGCEAVNHGRRGMGRARAAAGDLPIGCVVRSAGAGLDAARSGDRASRSSERDILDPIGGGRRTPNVAKNVLEPGSCEGFGKARGETTCSHNCLQSGTEEHVEPVEPVEHLERVEPVEARR